MVILSKPFLAMFYNNLTNTLNLIVFFLLKHPFDFKKIALVE